MTAQRVAEIEAKVAEAQARVEAVALPFRLLDGRVHDGRGYPYSVIDAPPAIPALIVAAVNREQRAIDHARDVLARHHMAEPVAGVLGDCCRDRGCCWACGRFISGRGRHRYSFGDCPEIAPLLAVWVTS